MKKLILIICTLLLATSSYSQIIVTLKDKKVTQEPKPANNNSIVVKIDRGKEFKADKFNDYCKDNQDFGELICKIDCVKKTITFTTKTDDKTTVTYYLCEKKGIFSLDQKDCEEKNEGSTTAGGTTTGGTTTGGTTTGSTTAGGTTTGGTTTGSTTTGSTTAGGTTTGGTTTDKNTIDLVDFPLAKFNSKSEENIEILNNRTIILDSRSNKCHNCDKTGLYKFKVIKDDKCKLIKAEALPINRYLSVMIQNYNFHDLERFTISVNSENYKYENDLSKTYDLVAKKDKAEKKDGDEIEATSSPKPKTEAQSLIKTYLDNVISILESYDYLNLNDLYIVESYKETLIKYAKEHKDEFDAENNLLKNEIIAWYPTFVSLTPISIDIPDNDEVKITYSLKEKGHDVETKSLGNFKTFGGVSVDYGPAFYLTDLKNNEVYTKTTTINGTNDTRAILSSSNEKSLGFGLNIDVSYRTGIHLRPTFNAGFFVPIEEDISPFFAVGPGVGFFGKNYKINFSWGMAYGKVNTIKEQYKDVNLDGLTLTNTDLVEKVLQSGHYYSLTFSFNIFK